MTANDGSGASGVIRCTFVALRSVDVLFRRTVDLIDVPRIGERVQLWVEGDITIGGTVRDVRWSIPRAGQPVVTVQVELSARDHRRFARRLPLTSEPNDSD